MSGRKLQLHSFQNVNGKTTVSQICAEGFTDLTVHLSFSWACLSFHATESTTGTGKVGLVHTVLAEQA